MTEREELRAELELAKSVRRVTADAVNHAAAAASNAVWEYASKFERREDYLPLEGLAQRVQRDAVLAGCEVLRRKDGS